MKIRALTLCLAVLSFTALVGCSEVRLGSADGIPAINLDSEVRLPAFVCGTPFSQDGVTVSSKAIEGGCELTVEKTITVAGTSIYAKAGDIKLSKVLSGIELHITKFALSDSSTGAAVDLSQLSWAYLSVNDELLADRDALTALPLTVRIDGVGLEPLKAQVDARTEITATLQVIAAVPDTVKIPATLKVDFEAQPEVLLLIGLNAL